MKWRLISCILVVFLMACGSTATDDPIEDTGSSPVDTTEPPADPGVISDLPVPEPDTTEPPVPDTTEPPEPAAITWTSHIQKIINTKCANCHTTQSKGGLKIKGYQTMDDSSPKCYADTTVAEAIAMKVQPNPGCKSSMPPYGAPPLSAEQKDQIKAWAEAGFPE